MEYTKEDKAKSWLHLVSTLVFLVLALLGTYYNFQFLLKLVFSVIAGLFIVKSFVIYHDYQHHAILKKSKLAKWIMTAFGIFVLAPSSIWKRTHDHHHQNNSKLSNSGIGSFPLLSKKKFEELPSTKQFLYLATRHPITIFSGYITLFIYDFNINSLMRSPKNHWDSAVALILHIAMGAYLFYLGGIVTLLISWVIPFVIANGLGAYLFYAQHNFPGATFDENENWKYTKAAIDSTSFLVMNPVMNWFTGNIGYHHVHHVNHHIPFYRLKEAMRNMPELQNPKTTTLHPMDMIACLKLKVWDPEKGMMTGL
ncbi:MAG: fatty acid desaturase [Flammeovirgaceae bacterium]|nr:fatty acid desaturase [Flammeovirgaceae bacterium]